MFCFTEGPFVYTKDQKESIKKIEETCQEETEEKTIHTDFSDLQLSSGDSDSSLDKDAPTEITQIHKNDSRMADFHTTFSEINLNTLGHWSIQISDQQKMLRQPSFHSHPYNEIRLSSASGNNIFLTGEVKSKIYLGNSN